MKNNPYLLIILISGLSAIAVVLVLNYLGHNNSVVTGGGVAGGIAGAISATLLRKKNK